LYTQIYRKANMSERVSQVERAFMALADKNRLRLLYLLRNGEATVNELCRAAAEAQPKVSRHLAYLRAMNMVSTRRDGKCIYYRLADPRDPFESLIVDNTIAWLDSVYGDGASTPRRPKSTTERRPAPIAEKPVLVSEAPQTAPSSNDEREMEVFLL